MAGARGSARRELVGRLVLWRRNRRRGGRVAGTRALRVGLRVAVPAAAILLAVAAVTYVGRRHSYFAVREVVVRHHGRLTAEFIRTAAGIEPGTSIWAVDLDHARAALERQPWIRDARLRRDLPHRIVMHVREYRPKAIVSISGSDPARYYVASGGRIFAALGATDSLDFPHVSGLAAADLKGDDAFGARAIRRVLALLEAAEHTGTIGAVSEVHVDRVRGLTVMPVHLHIPIEFGWEGFATKLAHLGEVLARWRGREGEIANVSCLFDDDVIVRTHAAAGVKHAS